MSLIEEGFCPTVVLIFFRRLIVVDGACKDVEIYKIRFICATSDKDIAFYHNKRQLYLPLHLFWNTSGRPRTLQYTTWTKILYENEMNLKIYDIFSFFF